MDTERIVLLVGVVVVVLVSRINRAVGGILGLFLTGGIFFWGWNVYNQGGNIGLLGTPISRTAFLVFVGLFLLFNLFSIWLGFKNKKGRGDSPK